MADLAKHVSSERMNERARVSFAACGSREQVNTRSQFSSPVDLIRVFIPPLSSGWTELVDLIMHMQAPLLPELKADGVMRGRSERNDGCFSQMLCDFPIIRTSHIIYPIRVLISIV